MKSIQIIHFSVAFCLTLAQLLLHPEHISAQIPLEVRQDEVQNRTITFAAPPPPSDIGEPGGRTAGGSRPDTTCSQSTDEISSVPLTAIAPIYPSDPFENTAIVFAATLSEHPTLWFYVPHPSPFTGKLVLQDQDDNLVKVSEIALPQRSGAFSVVIDTPLEVGQLYHWYFSIYCEAEPIAYVDGWIQRQAVSPALVNQLETVTTLDDKVRLYAANGFWYEALTVAAELHQTDPADQSWSSLLEIIDLEHLGHLL